jgi:hypothetical protein
MIRMHHPKLALLAAWAAVWVMPGSVTAQDADTREVQNYVLTDAGLSKYTQATKKLAALPRASASSCEDDDSDAQSLSDMVAKLDAVPGVKSAIQSAGMTTREYITFSMSLLQTGLAATMVGQSGGKLPAGVSKANVDFYNKHTAELEKLAALRKDCEDEAAEGDDPDE